jgi:hypothetical protein
LDWPQDHPVHILGGLFSPIERRFVMRSFVPAQAAIRCHFRTAGLCLLALLLAVSFAADATAAVRRRLNVNSNPPGALVYVDNQQIGTTPCAVDFTYYGTREIRLIKPGFETLTVNQPIPAPWYEYVPLDFVSENLIGMKVRDNRTVSFNLAPQLVIPTQELMGRANQLRQDTLQFGGVPVASVMPGVAPGPAIVPAPAPTVGPLPVPANAPPGTLVPPPAPAPLPGVGPPPFGAPSSPQPTFAPPPNPAPFVPRSP